MPEGVVEELLSDALSAMMAASQGASVCSFTKAGDPVPALKHSEGRVAALKELRRAGLEQSVLESLATVWHQRLEAQRARDAGQNWIAYTMGGIDALSEVTSRLVDADS